MADGLLDLSMALAALRDELEATWEAGRDRPVRFRVAEATLTVQAVTGREVDGTGKVRWWLVEAGGGARVSRETTQTLALTLQPALYVEGSAKPAPLDVGAEQTQPSD